MAAFILRRLAGLETEYVARFRPDDGVRRPLTLHLLFQLAEELKRRVPVVPADYPKKGFFLATGGAIWQERPGEGLDHPLIEGSTPECRGPLQLLTHQRAQDRLFAAAARDVAGGEFTLCKSDCDSDGNVYGPQENYELILARGWRLLVWRIGVFALLPLVVLGWMSVVALAFALLAYFAIAVLLYGMIRIPLLSAKAVDRDRRVREFLLGRWGGEPFRLMPGWISAIVNASEHILLGPMLLGLGALFSLSAFCDSRRGLLPFLITRPILSGSGRLCEDGSFHIAGKASAIRLANWSGLFRIHSIFSSGPQGKALLFFALASGRKFPSLLSCRQRLQINLSDSNLCDEAEYLRIATTMLLLDAVEAGNPVPIPVLADPIKALRAVIGDPTLRARILTLDGRWLTALEIQRIYLDACRRFVATQADPPVEAERILDRWNGALEDLETAPERLIGRLDWVTKQWLIETAGTGSSWEARKKIDLRYHELSPDGYFERLRSAGVIRAMLTDKQIDAAMTAPPPDTPAASRGRYIRQYASSTQRVRANWQSVSVGMPPKVFFVNHE